MSDQIRLKDFLSPKSDSFVRATISRKFEELISGYPKIPVAQLIAFIYRGKGEIQGQPWNWGDTRTLKRIEDVQRQLSEEYNPETGEFIDEPIDNI